jgi:HSP20 family protein
MPFTPFDPFEALGTLPTHVHTLVAHPVVAHEIGSTGDWSPAIDVQETDTEYVVKADLPEIPREQVKVGIESGILVVEGERRPTRDEATRTFHRHERAYGTFVRRLAVPSNVDESRVTAECRDGVLSVHLPKAPLAPPRSVRVPIAPRPAGPR